MAKKCKYYIDIYKSESALRKLRKFHVLKVFNLRRVQACTVYMLSLLICTHHACHTCRDRDYCSKQRLGTSHAIIATFLYISWLGQKVECFYLFGINNFSGSTRLLWIRVSLQKCSVMQTWLSLCFGYQPIKFLYFFPIPFQQLVFSLVRLLTRNLFSDFAFHFIFRTHPSLPPTILV